MYCILIKRLILFSSSSSGEIRDDSDDEAEDAARVIQPEAALAFQTYFIF